MIGGFPHGIDGESPEPSVRFPAWTPVEFPLRTGLQDDHAWRGPMADAKRRQPSHPTRAAPAATERSLRSNAGLASISNLAVQTPTAAEIAL